jgi:hypothetical protein
MYNYYIYKTQRKSIMVSSSRDFNVCPTEDSNHVQIIFSAIPNTESPGLTVYNTIISIRAPSFYMRVSQTIPSYFHSHTAAAAT